MNSPAQIIIVGGGTAGWMAANLLNNQLAKWRIKITLIESNNIATVGVGEGSTPYLKEFFDTLGIDESEWMPACNATYKCGIRFPGWSTVEHQTSYFHPFYSDLDGPFAAPFFEACNKKRHGQVEATNPDHYFFTQQLAICKKAPKSHTRNDDLNYGYHFDAALLGEYLKQNGIKNGVKHINDNVESVHLDKQGNIAILSTYESGPIRGDIFIDCSGFKGLLIQQTLNEKLIPYTDYLFCDSAVALPTPHSNTGIAPETISKGMKAGWMWNIPLVSRYGNGYVFSSNYLSPEAAEQELRKTLNIEKSDEKALHLNWTPGRISRHWKQNCVAIGLSQGFLEPLEAPMLFIIQRSIEGFIEHFVTGGFSDQFRDKFNQEINIIIDGTRDYLQAHYKLNSRSDSDFWRRCRDNPNMSTPLQDILRAWKTAENFDQVLAKHQTKLAYLKTSWYCLLAGHGYFKHQINNPSQLVPQQDMTDTLKGLCDQYLDHQTYLKAMI